MKRSGRVHLMMRVVSAFGLLGVVFGASSMASAQSTSAPTTAAQQDGATGTLIVLNKAEASASLIDLATGKVTAKLDTGEGPHEVTVSPDGKTAVAANYGAQTDGSTLSVFDLTDNTVAKVIDLKKYHRPHGIMFLADGKRVAVTTEVEQKLLVVNVATGEVEMAVDTDANVSHMVVLSPDSKRAYVSAIGSGSVAVVDLVKGERIATIATAPGAEGIDISPDGKEVWVGNRQVDTISIIDTRSLEVVHSIKCASFPIRVKFTIDGKHVLVSNARSGDVAIIDAAERKEIKRISMEATAIEEKEGRLFSDRFGQSPVPVGILVHPDGRHAYIANTNADVVTVLDLTTWEIAGRLVAGREPDGLAIAP